MVMFKTPCQTSNSLLFSPMHIDYLYSSLKNLLFFSGYYWLQSETNFLSYEYIKNHDMDENISI